MDKKEAKTLLKNIVDSLQKMPYSQFANWIKEKHVQAEQITSPAGNSYNIESEAVWDDRSKTTIRVIISIDDGTMSSFSPMTEDFAIKSDGSLL